VDVDTNRPVLVSDIGTNKARNLLWADDTHVLAEFSTTMGGPAAFGFHYEAEIAFNVSTSGKVFQVFGNHRYVSKFIAGYYGTRQKHGHSYAYFGGVEQYHDLYRVNLDSDDIETIAIGDEGATDWVVGTDGTVLAHSDYRSDDGRWRLYAGARHSKLLMEVKDPLETMALVSEGRTPDSVLLIDERSARDRMVELSLSDGSHHDLLGDLNVDDIVKAPATGFLQGFRTYEPPHAFLFDPALEARYVGAAKAFPGYQVRLVSATADFGRMILKTDGGDDSGTYWLVTIATGKAIPIGYAYPAIRAADVGPTSLFRYNARDGLAIEAVLTLPPGRKAAKLPLIVMPHGGPMDVSDSLGFDWWAQAYASAGYAVLQPNYRGSSGHGKPFREAGWGQWGKKMLTDISDGMTALGAQGVIDPKRVCIVGASYGGYAALAGVTLQKGLYRCAVAVGGVADLRQQQRWWKRKFGARSSVERYSWKVTGADRGDYDMLDAISPIHSAKNADAPILLIHGSDDTVVPIKESEDMAAALKDAGKPVQFVKLDGDDHWLSRAKTRVEMLKAAVAFVKANDPPD
jgi:dipeptidyl aminopeptidase/acylaminoacyl peptidase